MRGISRGCVNDAANQVALAKKRALAECIALRVCVMRMTRVIAPDLRVWMSRVREGRLWRGALAAALFCTSAAAMDLPSGQTVTLHDSLLEVTEVDALPTLVLRYIAPRIARSGGDLGYDAVAGDMDVLCATDGLQAMALADQPVGQIVIVLMDRPVDRGIPDSQATQLISAYVPTEGGCAWQ